MRLTAIRAVRKGVEMDEEKRAAAAVRATIDDLREEGWRLAQQYVLDRRPMTLNRLKELRETADLLVWAAQGRGGSQYDLNVAMGDT